MNYQPEDKIVFWKRLLLHAERINKSEIKFIDLAYWSPNFLENYYKESENLVNYIFELASINPPSIKIQKIFSTKKISEILQNENNVYIKKLKQNNSGLYSKLLNHKPLLRKELQEAVSESVHLHKLYSNISLKLNIDINNLEKLILNYIEKYISGELVPNFGQRVCSFSIQRQNFSHAIKQIAAHRGYKNIAITLDEINNILLLHPNTLKEYRFYESFLAFEKLKDIEIHLIRGKEIVFSLTNQSLTELKDDLKFMPDYSQILNLFKDKEFHWYCPICGNEVKKYKNLDSLKSAIERVEARCSNKHINRIFVEGSNLMFDIKPVHIQEAFREKSKNE